MTAQYSPGSHPVAATAHGFVVLSPDTSHALVSRVWEKVDAGRGLAAVLEALTGAYGTSLSAIPPFAVVLREHDTVRVAVRGDIAVDVETTSGVEQLTGVGVTTWSERVLSQATRIVVTAAPADAPAGLPIGTGVVLASLVEWTPANTGVPAEVRPGETEVAGEPTGSASPAQPESPAETASAPESEFPSEPQSSAEPESAPEPESPSTPADPAEPSMPDPSTPDALTPERPEAPERPETPERPEAAATSDPAYVPAPPPSVVGPPVPGLVPGLAPVTDLPPLPPAREASAPARPAPAAPGIIDSAAVAALSDTLLPQETTFTVGDDDRDGGARGEDGSAETSRGTDDADDLDATEISERSRAATAASNDELETEVTVIRGDSLPAAAPARTAAPAPLLGDHDGQTVSLAEARAARDRAAPAAGDATPPAPLPVASGSTTPPLAPPRLPSPGQLRVSTGQVVPLNRTVVFGRRPRSTRITGTDLPHLITVESPQQDISRSHLEVRVEGGSIIATDLDTTNGTLLRRAGADPVRLHPHEAAVVVHGDVLDLGDGVTVAVEEDA